MTKGSKIAVLPIRERAVYQRAKKAVIRGAKKALAHRIVYLMRVYDQLDSSRRASGRDRSRR
jgi:hypothetical protein